MIAFFDLDGTLIDITDRWYQLHIDTAKRYGLPVIEKKEYIEKKRSGIAEADILKNAGDLNAEALSKYLEDRVVHIEDDQYLDLDKLCEGIIEVLTTWKKNYVLILVTGRKRKEALHEQLQKLEILSFFSQVQATGNETKDSFFEDLQKDTLTNSVFVSDSYEDYLTAKRFGIRPIIVSFGARNIEYFQSRSVNDLVQNPKELIFFV